MRVDTKSREAKSRRCADSISSALTSWQKQFGTEQRNRDADDYYRREIGRGGRAELTDMISLPYAGNGNGYS